MQARSQDFVQEGADLVQAQDTPYQTEKSLDFAHYFLVTRQLSFLNYLILFQYSRQEGWGHSTPFGCVPAAGRINSGKIHYIMIPVLNTPYWQWIRKNAGLV